MSLRLLRTLVAIADNGSFGAAADVICVSHAAVSQQMKSLEEKHQICLFDRTKRSPELNQLGQAMVLQAREIIDAYDTMVPSLLGEEGLMGELTIGAVPTTLTGLIPRSIGALRMEYPGLRIRVVPGLSGELLPQVERGALDAAILSEPAHVSNFLSWQPFAEEPLVLLASPDTTSDDPVTLLKKYPFIRFSRKAWVGMQIDNWLRQMKLKVRESMELETLESISSMVSHNLGVSIVPMRCVPSSNPPDLKRIPLVPPPAPRILGVISRSDSIKFRITAALLAELARSVEQAGQVRVIRPWKTDD